VSTERKSPTVARIHAERPDPQPVEGLSDRVCKRIYELGSRALELQSLARLIELATNEDANGSNRDFTGDINSTAEVMVRIAGELWNDLDPVNLTREPAAPLEGEQ
jgi:hypothetical protein